MGGKIEMVPNPEGGSIFRFTLPVERSREPPRDIPPAEDRELPILAVDDRPESRHILVSYLKDLGYLNVESAASGEEALRVIRAAAARDRPYRLCFLDMNMPVMDGWRLAAEIRGDQAVSETSLILMVPHGLLGRDTKMTLLKWFKAYINKPVRRRELADVIGIALAEEPQELEAAGDQEGESPPFLEAPEPGELPGTGAGYPGEPPQGGALSKPLVLIAEDHPVNRKLFALMMDKLGYPSVLADDGQDALEKAAGRPVSLVFMDIQMPRMNGYEAAENLRRRGFRRPIIAVTASALSGERERCVQAGIDDILIKPFKRADIEKMLLKWIGRGGGETIAGETIAGEKNGAAGEKDPVSPPPEPSREEIFNTRELLETFMDDIEAVKPLLARFLPRTEEQINGISRFLEEGDRESARLEAHTIKGSSLTLGGRELGLCAARLEQALKNADRGEIETGLSLLKPAFLRFKGEAELFIREH
jgi:CheY-like chemotaxis protein